jgi:hypothetical protein
MLREALAMAWRTCGHIACEAPSPPRGHDHGRIRGRLQLWRSLDEIGDAQRRKLARASSLLDLSRP